MMRNLLALNFFSLFSFFLFFGTGSVDAAITSHPRNVSACASSSAVLRFGVKTDFLFPEYQWQVPGIKGIWVNVQDQSDPRAGVVISGSNEATISLTFSKSFPLDKTYSGSQIRCVVTFKLTNYYSNAAITTVLSAPYIISSPESTSKLVGESVTFNVSGGGTINSYQWNFNGSPISGATSSSYTIGSIQLTDAGDYSCSLLGCTTATSAAATLAVTAPTYPNGWAKQTSGSGLNILSIVPLSELKAWALTQDNDKLLKTVNGGTTWTSVNTGYNGSWWSIYFINESIGMVGGYNGISRTTDGGTTWTYTNLLTASGLDPGTDYFHIYSIHFVDASNGWAVGTNGIILKTVDGGATWTKRSYKNDPTPVSDVVLYSVFFFDVNNGFIGGQNGKLYKTSNAGASWTEIPSGTNVNITDITFTSATRGFFTAPYYLGSIFETSNGGATWDIANVPSYEYFYSIDFVDANNGWAAGFYYDGPQKGRILKTKDGGATWVSQRIDNASILNEIRMLNADHGWVVGSGGEIQRTGKGGCYDPVVNLYADQTICGNLNYTLKADTFVNNYNSSYLWSNGSTNGSITVDTTANYSVVLSNECNKTTTDDATISFLEPPVAYAGEDVTVCKGQGIQLFASGGSSYSWSGSSLDDYQISNPIASPPKGPAYYTVTVTDENNCTGSDGVYVNVSTTYEGEQICLVTIDLETGKNMVVWEKTHNVGTASYNVYREGIVQNSYDLLGNVPFDQISVFVDATSIPEQQQYKYKISSVDTCGNESAKSKWHKTMLLQYVSSDQGVNLNWQEYGVETGSMSFNSYAIFRGSDSTSLSELTTISASFLAFTDNTADALSKKMYYRVGGVKANACDPAEIGGKKTSSGPFVHSLSNLEDNRLQGTGISNNLADALNLSVYPSPFSESSTISYTLRKSSKMKVEVYNVVGEKIGVLLDETQTAGTHKLEMKAADVNYVSGLYYLRISVDDAVTLKKTMLSR
jgi:photosystem II stability/assembly factor-like uncharacterized protein